MNTSTHHSRDAFAAAVDAWIAECGTLPDQENIDRVRGFASDVVTALVNGNISPEKPSLYHHTVTRMITDGIATRPEDTTFILLDAFAQAAKENIEQQKMPLVKQLAISMRFGRFLSDASENAAHILQERHLRTMGLNT